MKEKILGGIFLTSTILGILAIVYLIVGCFFLYTTTANISLHNPANWNASDTLRANGQIEVSSNGDSFVINTNSGDFVAAGKPLELAAGQKTPDFTATFTAVTGQGYQITHSASIYSVEGTSVSFSRYPIADNLLGICLVLLAWMVILLLLSALAA